MHGTKYMNWPLIHAAFAQATIKISSGIPGTNPTTGAGTSPGAFIANFYQFALLIGGILAFGAIVFGGVKSAISAGNPSAISEARQWIWSALLGLLLLGGAYIILYTINPNLINLNLPALSPLNISTAGTPFTLPNGQLCENTDTGSSCATSGGLDQATAQASLAAFGITTTSSGNCTDQSNPRCTSLQGMQQSTVNELVQFKQMCQQSNSGCTVTVTGGTEVGHANGDISHLNGYKADIDPNPQVSSFITQNFTPIGTRSSDGAAQFKDPVSGAIYAREGTHWDITVPPKP